MKNHPLPKRFYARSALKVAPELLGKILCRERNGVVTAGRIVEVEAYLGSEDPASHAYRGKTPRNEVMFGPPGHAYVYFTYGTHFCVNVVTGREGEASAVLIRALEPIEGIGVMQRRRNRTKLEELASGPGKLTQALSIGRRLNGNALGQKPLWICDGRNHEPVEFETTARIGITRGVEWPYRFAVAGSRFVTSRSARSRPPGG
ncbi:MAG: DNA-3-methyladenine glycosylase [Pseudomonadota bacterium]